jgi:hypothetical protein
LGFAKVAIAAHFDAVGKVLATCPCGGHERSQPWRDDGGRCAGTTAPSPGARAVGWVKCSRCRGSWADKVRCPEIQQASTGAGGRGAGRRSCLTDCVIWRRVLMNWARRESRR